MQTPLAVVRFTPKAGTHAQVEAILRRMVPATRGEPGCRRYDLYNFSDPSGVTLFFLVENYADESAIAAHRETEHYKQYRLDILPLLEQPPQVQLLQPLDARPHG